MRNNMKRAAAGAAVAAVVLSGLIACSSDSKGDASKVTELTIPTAETPWLDSYKQMAAEYTKETGVKINLATFPMDGLLTQQSQAAQSGSNAFDLFQLNEQWVGQFYDNQWVQPLTDIDPDFTWDKGLIEFDGVGRWDADARTTTDDGTPYSLPINGNIQLFMYRTDLYDQLGLSVPPDWDGVVANGNAAKQAGVVPDGYVARGKTPTYDFSALLFSNGGKWFTDEKGGDWKPAIDTKEFRAALQQFKALADIGPAAPQTIAQAEATTLMQGGSVLNATFVAAVAAALENPGASSVAGKIGYAELPGKTPVSGVWTLGIPTGLPADRAQAAYKFMTWLTGKDAMQKWADLGGVTTRTDLTSDRPDLKAIVDSADDIHGGLRYTFTPAMLDVTDPAIGQYLAGQISLDDAISTMQSGVTDVVTKVGFLK